MDYDYLAKIKGIYISYIQERKLQIFLMVSLVPFIRGRSFDFDDLRESMFMVTVSRI